MYKKLFGIIFCVLLGIGALFGLINAVHSEKSIKIGILMPIDHAALRDIVAGFEAVVSAAFPDSVTFNLQSAQGDIKLQRSIIELFVGQKVDMVVPLGTSATQMTLSLVKNQPIVSLAAMYPESERQKRYPRNMTGVLDEIGGRKKLDFIKAILPNAKTLTLIFHGANEKNHPEVEELKAYSRKLGINLQTFMIQILPDLEAAGRGIAMNSDAIFILKDNLIASGIRLLTNIAEKRKIPVITADEGTIREGATLALGVKERMIGEEGGKLAVKVLKGIPIAHLPMQEIKELSVFYNPTSCKEQNIEIIKLQEYAAKNHYQLVKIENLKKENN